MAHAPICQIKLCPEKTHGRVETTDKKRLDLCKWHLENTQKLFKNRIKILEIWGDK